MRVHELCYSVEILHFLLPESSAVSPVEGGDVRLDGLHHLLPLMADLLWQLPAIVPGILDSMAWWLMGGREEERGREGRDWKSRLGL